jgi:hypothetical protein
MEFVLDNDVPIRGIEDRRVKDIGTNKWDDNRSRTVPLFWMTCENGEIMKERIKLTSPHCEDYLEEMRQTGK